jgi:hypothetical protein
VSWYPQKVICYATAVREVRLRRVHKKFENAKPNEAGLLPLDGVGVWMAPEDLQPEEKLFD